MTKQVIAIGVCFELCCISATLIVVGYLLSEQHILKQKLIMSENKVFLVDKSNQILESECDDLRYKSSIARKYEDGYRDALIRLNNPSLGTFDEGYEAAKLVYGNGTYTDGYHAAIEQLSYTSNKCPLGEKGE